MFNAASASVDECVGPDGGLGYGADTLGLPPELMRSLGYKVVDLVVDRLLSRGSEPAIKTSSPDELLQLLGGPLPAWPSDAANSLDMLAHIALANQQHGDHPRYFARVPGPASYAAILGEWLSTGFNSVAASWEGGSGPAALELIVIRWLAEFLKLPETTEGLLLSGGSMANLTAMAVARAEVGMGMVYISDQTHSCVNRGLRTLGYSVDQIRVLNTDDRFMISPNALQEAIEADRRAGKNPRMVVASAGTVNTGACDGLSDISKICRAEDIWLHVDGAYGGVAAATDLGSQHVSGLALADSLVIDPHKWLFQPYDVGACFIQRRGALERCFSMSPEYLRDIASQNGRVNFFNRGPELTRRARAAKLWMSLRTYGAERFRSAIDAGIARARDVERYLASRQAVWELVSPAQIGIVCFALRNDRGISHATRALRLAESGFACVTSTDLHGKSVLRMCTINPLTSLGDVTETIHRLETD